MASGMASRIASPISSCTKTPKPMESSILTEVFLPLALAVIMLGMGLSLKIDDFRRITVYPKPVLIGLVNQLIIYISHIKKKQATYYDFQCNDQLFVVRLYYVIEIRM